MSQGVLNVFYETLTDTNIGAKIVRKLGEYGRNNTLPDKVLDEAARSDPWFFPRLTSREYRYAGPFNSLENGEPINDLDRFAREHDYLYHAYGVSSYFIYNMADEIFLKKIEARYNIHPIDTIGLPGGSGFKGEKHDAFLAYQYFYSKKLLAVHSEGVDQYTGWSFEEGLDIDGISPDALPDFRVDDGSKENYMLPIESYLIGAKRMKQNSYQLNGENYYINRHPGRAFSKVYNVFDQMSVEEEKKVSDDFVTPQKRKGDPITTSREMPELGKMGDKYGGVRQRIFGLGGEPHTKVSGIIEGLTGGGGIHFR